MMERAALSLQTAMAKGRESQLIVVNSVPGLYLLKVKNDDGKTVYIPFMQR